VEENAAGQRKGEKKTGQGGVYPPVAINEKASPRPSTRKNPPETDHGKGRGLSSIESTRRGGADLPVQGASDKDKDNGREVQGGVDDTAGEQGEGLDKKGQGGVVVVVGGSGDQDRTEDNVQESSKAKNTQNQNKSRKVISHKLPLKKHRHCSIYYHSAFTTYPRHKRPENISSNPDVLDLLLKVLSSRARVSTVTVWNPIIESWNKGKKPSFLSLPPLTQESNLGNDGLTLQSTYDVKINDDEYQVSLGADPYLLVASMPPDDKLKRHYTKLLQGITSIKQMTLRGNTLSAVRRRGELMYLRIADVSAKDVMLQIDDAEFQDWCASNSYA
jgi:hypothetical protein